MKIYMTMLISPPQEFYLYQFYINLEVVTCIGVLQFKREHFLEGEKLIHFRRLGAVLIS